MSPKPSVTPCFVYSPLMEAKAFARAVQAFDGDAAPALRQLPAGRVGEARGMDLVFNAQSQSWGGRIASVVKRPGHSVFGVLLGLEGAQRELWRQLEGGAAVEEQRLQVHVGTELVEAMALAVPEDKGVPTGAVSERYTSALGEAAELAGLPRQYSDRLKAEAMIVARVQAAGRAHGLS